MHIHSPILLFNQSKALKWIDSQDNLPDDILPADISDIRPSAIDTVVPVISKHKVLVRTKINIRTSSSIVQHCLFAVILLEQLAVNIDIDIQNSENFEILKQIAVARLCLLKGNEPDLDKAAAILFDDFRSGRLGRMTLEEIPE